MIKIAVQEDHCKYTVKSFYFFGVHPERIEIYRRTKIHKEHKPYNDYYEKWPNNRIYQTNYEIEHFDVCKSKYEPNLFTDKVP